MIYLKKYAQSIPFIYLLCKNRKRNKSNISVLDSVILERLLAGASRTSEQNNGRVGMNIFCGLFDKEKMLYTPHVIILCSKT